MLIPYKQEGVTLPPVGVVTFTPLVKKIQLARWWSFSYGSVNISIAMGWDSARKQTLRRALINKIIVKMVGPLLWQCNISIAMGRGRKINITRRIDQ